MLCIGIDSGTTSTKALVLDVETGKTLASARHPHTFVEDLPHGHAEQLPQTWVDAAEHAIGECLTALGKRREEVAAIGVSAQQHGLVVVDERIGRFDRQSSGVTPRPPPRPTS
jgi:xylulokinase